MNSHSFTIGILSTTAVALFVGLLVIHSRPRPALADGMTILRGDYSITVGALTSNDEELVYLINAPANRLVVYRFDAARKQIQPVQSLSLQEMRGAAGAPRAPGRP